MNDHAYNRERRTENRLERLGSREPACIVCGENDPAVLELHHLAGKGFGDDCVVVCRNHHRKLTDKQKEHPPILPGKPAANECEGRKLLGIADVMELRQEPAELFALVRETGQRLIARAQIFRRSAEEDEL